MAGLLSPDRSVEVRASPIHGLGLFAAEAIPSATIIFTDAPLLTVDINVALEKDPAFVARPDVAALMDALLSISDEHGDDKPDDAYPSGAAAAIDGIKALRVADLFAALPVPGAATAWALADAWASPDKTAAGILRTNALHDDGGVDRLFARVARINHACGDASNATWAFVTLPDGVRVCGVVAARPIAAGAEILLSYGRGGGAGSAEAAEARRARLARDYNFECGCATCAGGAPPANDASMRAAVERGSAAARTATPDALRDPPKRESVVDRLSKPRAVAEDDRPWLKK